MAIIRVDWFRVIADLQAMAGLSRADVARQLDVSESTVRAWYSGQNASPTGDLGLALAQLWSARTGRPLGDLPPRTT